MKRNQVVEQGTITHLGGHPQGAAPAPWINSNGEIAVVLRLDNGPHALAILTPGSP